MSKLSIFTKLFLALLLGILMISATILVSVQWSFKQGFNQYLLQAEAKELDKLSPILVAAYAKEGNWQSLNHNRHLWFDLLRQGLDKEHLPPKISQNNEMHQGNPFPIEAPPDFDHPPPPPFMHMHGHPPHHDHFPDRPPPEMMGKPDIVARFLGSRLKLLDADKHFIEGSPSQQQTEFLRPLYLNDQLIGWLVVQSSDLITDHIAQLFVTQQIRNTYFIALATLVLALIFAYVLTRKLLAPIQLITVGANALVRGDYETQIRVDSQDELGQLASDFNLLARTLQRNEQARRQWIADISHELRTPLAILRGEIEAVQDGVREFSPDNVKSLHAEVMSLNRLVDDLYELSLSDLGGNHYHKEVIDIVGIVQEVTSNQHPRFKLQQLTLHAHLDEKLQLPVLGDARRLHQLFSNICENSRRYTSPKGYCEISAYATDYFAIITVEDTAPGVPDAAIAHLFDRLFRVDKSRNRELGGAGLGLAICEAIVSAHNGTLQAYHSPHGGLGISIRIPLFFNTES